MRRVGAGIHGGFMPRGWLRLAGWGVLGRIAQAYAVKRFGDTWGQGVGGWHQGTSPYGGTSWTMKNYAIGALGTWVAAQLAKRFGGLEAAKAVWQGGVQDMLTRMVWNEIFGRSTWAMQQFGHYPHHPGYPSAMGAYPAGTIIDDGYGTRWYQMPDGNQVSMMGYDRSGELMVAGPYDGMPVRESALDGRIVDASALDGPMGHYSEESTPATEAIGSSYADPYHAAYGFQGGF